MPYVEVWSSVSTWPIHSLKMGRTWSMMASFRAGLACTTALIDRVIHHALIIAIQGDSYRKRDAELVAKSHSRRGRKKSPVA